MHTVREAVTKPWTNWLSPPQPAPGQNGHYIGQRPQSHHKKHLSTDISKISTLLLYPGTGGIVKGGKPPTQ